jgi:uncharacterized membrane protein YqhA
MKKLTGILLAVYIGMFVALTLYTFGYIAEGINSMKKSIDVMKKDEYTRGIRRGL